MSSAAVSSLCSSILEVAMETEYKAWAILSNGKYVNDEKGNVGPALFATRRDAQAWWNPRSKPTPGKVVRVCVTVATEK